MGDLNVYGYQNAFEESISAVTATPSVELGSRRVHKGEQYVYCYNAGGASIGSNVIAKFVTAASGYTVAGTALTDTFNPAVGVCKNAAVPDGSYGWFMTKGFVNVKAKSNMTGNYIAIACGLDGYALECPITGTVGQTAVVIGHAMNVDTVASGAAYCFIRTGV
jgi:hypothetical protein